MMATGDPTPVDNLLALDAPVQRTDRMIVGRGNDLYRMDATRWRGGGAARKSLVIPQASDFATIVNTNSTTFTNFTHGLELKNTNKAGGDSLTAALRSIPATTWDVRLGIVHANVKQNFITTGFCLRESATGKIMSFGAGYANVQGIVGQRWNSATSFNSTLFQVGERPSRMWYRAIKNGSNIELYASRDPSYFGDKIYSEALTASFTTAPNQWGAFVNGNNFVTPKYNVCIHVIDWSEA